MEESNALSSAPSTGLSLLMSSYSLPSSPEISQESEFSEDMFETYSEYDLPATFSKTKSRHSMYGKEEAVQKDANDKADGNVEAICSKTELETSIQSTDTSAVDIKCEPENEVSKENLDGDKENCKTNNEVRTLSLPKDDIMSSLSQDSECSKTGLVRNNSNWSISFVPPVIKDELLEYTDGDGHFFYVSPDDIMDELDRSNSPTFLPEQEFITLDSQLKQGHIWNKNDSIYSEILHNVGLIRKEAAEIIASASIIQKSKLNLLLNTWSNQKAFTDCLAEMTDCDNYFSPIGYNTVLVTDPCMSARYDCLSTGLNQQEVERKQRDEFYNFTEEKSFAYEQCKLCSKLFSNRFGLRQHIAHMHPSTNPEELLRKEGLYSCLRCKKPFNTQAQLKKHFKKVHIPKANDDMNFKCSHCGEYFKTRVLLHRHTSDKHRNRSKAEAAELHEPWSCELCKNIFYKKSNFIKHMQKIHGKMKVSERLLNSAKLSAQLAPQYKHGKDTRSNTTSPKPLRTTKEPKEKRTRAVRKLEIKTQSTESLGESDMDTTKTEEKKDSPLSVESSEKLEAEPVVKKEPAVNVTCLFCKLCFMSYSDLQLHCTEVHNEGNKIILLKMFTIIASQPHGINYQCILCTKISTTAPIALSHLQTSHLTDVEQVKGQISAQLNPAPVASSISDLDFMSLTCKFCHKTFKSTKIKRKHERTIHNDQSILCYYCFIPITNRTELTKHIKSEHTGSKCLFKCRWCDEHFTSIPKRCTHMKEYHSSDVASVKHSNFYLDTTPPQPVTVIPPQSSGDGVDSPVNLSTWCSKCKIDFPDLDHKSNHDRLIHNEDQKYYCLYCFASYESRGLLINHIAIYHSGKKMYKCKWCEIQFDTLYQRCVHLKEIHGISPATIDRDISRERCLSEDDVPPQLNKVSAKETYQNTSSRAIKQKPYLVRTCRFCDAEITSMILKKHLIEHRHRDYFVCIFCDKTVPSIGGMKSHILRNHPFITTRKLSVSNLPPAEAQRIASIEHNHKGDRKVTIASTNEPPPPRISTFTNIVYPCQICHFVYSLHEHVEHHWKQHSNGKVREWTCTLCDEQYSEFKSFSFHIDMHRSDPFTFAQSNIELQNICRICNIAVETKQAINGHILIHRTVENFLCIFCKAQSVTFRMIVEHISQSHLNTDALADDPSRHLNETPFNSSTFKCSICLKLCNNQFNLNSHTKAHILGGKPCTLCKFKFRDMLSLKHHLQYLHGASVKYVASIESNGASRSDAVPDYCELCDTTFSSQGKFQRHRRSCRNTFKAKHAGKQNNIMALLEAYPDPAGPNSEFESASDGVDISTSLYENNSDNESESDNISNISSDSDSQQPMEIPMKPSTDSNLFVMTSSPHSYNTRKRPRTESYANIVPVKMLPFSYEEKGDREEGAKEIPEDTDSKPKTDANAEEHYCETCELKFSTSKQLYWHRHTKRHLAMESIYAKSTGNSLGKHECNICSVRYGCKKQLFWHKKIKHSGLTTDEIKKELDIEIDGRDDKHDEKDEKSRSPYEDAVELSSDTSSDDNDSSPENIGDESVKPRKNVYKVSYDPINELQPGQVLKNSKDEYNPEIHSKYYCRLCKMDYKTNKKLYNHKRTLLHIQLAKRFDPSFTETRYFCEECDLEFESYKQRWNHKKTVEHKAVIAKLISEGKFTPQSIQEEQMEELRMGDAESSDEAEDVPESLKQYENMTSHVCLDCDCVFQNKGQMSWHARRFKHKTISIESPVKNTKRYKFQKKRTLEPGPEKSSSNSQVTKQKVSDQAQSDCLYPCKDCDLTFNSFRAYSLHCKQHLKEGFKCMVCSQKFQFKNYNNVKRHIMNIHKIAGVRASNYLRTFHDFDENPEPLVEVDPADVVASERTSKTNADNSKTSNTSTELLEKLLEDVGMSMELAEQFEAWHKPTKCKFCNVDFSNVSQFLIHTHDEHDKNFHRYFLLCMANGKNSSDEEVPSLDESVNPSDDNDDGADPPSASIRIKRRKPSKAANSDSKKQKLGLKLKSNSNS